ncbi:MAG: UPF0758 protein [Patescibacteria group bacterium]|nr:MAG: UPF0758 protein [Patescibacteria group bacterium]
MLDKSKLGHRQRLRKRFLQSGLDGFLDYEIVELLLTLGTPIKDCKQQAKELIKRFKTINNVLNASAEDLQKIKGVGPNNIFGIKLFKALFSRYLEEKIPEKINFKNVESVVKYLQEKYREQTREFFLVLSLNFRSQLIKISEISIGTVNMSLAHPREIFKEAIQSSASAIILAHNHPSGDCNPSEEDINTTKKLVESGRILGIEVLDHIIFTSLNYFSFKKSNLI